MTEYLIITGVMSALVVILSCLDAISTVLGWKKGAKEKNKVEIWFQAQFARLFPDHPNEAWEYFRAILGAAIGVGAWFLPQPISAIALAAVLFPLAITVWSNYRLAWGRV